LFYKLTKSREKIFLHLTNQETLGFNIAFAETNEVILKQ